MATSGAAPSRSERAACWEARDAYFQCLDIKGVLAPGDEGRACLSDRRKFEKDCVRSWVDYFTKLRVNQARQKLLMAQSGPSQRSADQSSTMPEIKKPAVPPVNDRSGSNERLV